MMKIRRFGIFLSLAAALAACSGGEGSVSAPTSGSTGGASTPTPTPTSGTCSLTNRQNWVFSQMQEWYLFPETLPSSLNPAPYASVQDYIDALTATARSQSKDRYFTYITSIAEETAYYNSGSSAGFGFRMSVDATARRVFIAESFEGTPALAAGIDRGTELLAIGTGSGSLQTVDSIIATQGSAGVTNALGPSDPGVARVLRVKDPDGTIREVTVTKADYTLTPVSSRYGAKIIDDGGTKIGYVNLRTFIDTADPALRSAFSQFRAAGITKVIFDLRYNGGGLVSIAELVGNLFGRDRTRSQVLDYTTFRASKSSNNDVTYFNPQPESIAPMKIAFIGTGGTASASELVINSQVPYLGANAALIGTNTYGKPVGQIAIDRSACDDRLRVVAFRTENADHQGDYYTGLASVVKASCQAGDDLTHPLGDPAESSVRTALDFLAGRSCSPISASGQGAQAARAGKMELLTPDRPNTAQREVPGLF